MATYLELVNLVLRQTNDVVLEQNTFAASRGFHASIKDAVNFAIRDINQSEIEWPFNYFTTEQVLTAEVNNYAFPVDIQWPDWESFHLEADGALDILAKHLTTMTYDEWQFNRRASDENNTTGIRIPIAVFKFPNDFFGVTPIPDRAYTISYDYYGFPAPLALYNDVTTIPDRFKFVITDGAMYYAYMFRDNMEQAQVAQDKFQAGIKNMRTLLINKYERVNDTRIGYKTKENAGYGIGW